MGPHGLPIWVLGWVRVLEFEPAPTAGSGFGSKPSTHLRVLAMSTVDCWLFAPIACFGCFLSFV